jgi:hypothetical protein
MPVHWQTPRDRESRWKERGQRRVWSVDDDDDDDGGGGSSSSGGGSGGGKQSRKITCNNAASRLQVHALTYLLKMLHFSIVGSRSDVR